MYSNWKMVSEDSHPSGLTPKEGMASYNSANHGSRMVNGFFVVFHLFAINVQKRFRKLLTAWVWIREYRY
jgi:hypothetical protein